jgi:hypothetical protein
MAAGLTTFAQIQARVNDLIDDTLAVARMGNYLMPTVTSLSAMGMMNRTVNEYNTVTFAAAGEDDDTGAQQFTKDALSTLTPAAHRARVDITDQRAETDFDSEMANASMELGSAAAQHVDTNIATLFSSATGGTIGSAGTIITWAHITAAYAILNNAGIPAGAPVFCALHPFQWEPLLVANTIAGASIAVAPGFQDRLVAAPNFFSVPRFQGVTFVISNSIAIDGDSDAYGCMYVPQAFAVDSRKAFNIRPERDESRELTELNASMWYAYGVWRPGFAVAILSDAATPSV